MATIDLGKLRFTWKGIFDANAAYERDDVVHVDGSTYVVVVDDIAANGNEAQPDANNKFELMARGLNFRGEYNASNTYLHNEVVTFESAAWISLRSAPFTGITPGTDATAWDVLVPAPLNTPLTTPGDMVYVDNDGSRVRLPIGENDATLTVIKKPLETFPRAFVYDVLTNGVAAVDTISAADASRTAGTYNLVTGDYTTANTGDNAHFTVVVDSNGAASVTVTAPGGGFTDDEVITVQDAQLGGGGGAALTFQVDGLSATRTARVTDEDDNTVFFTNNPATLNVTRGRSYTVRFGTVTGGATYSLKQTRSAGNANRLTGSPDSANASGQTITFNPQNFASSVTSFFIGDEIGGADQVQFTVNEEIRVPAWAGGALTNYKPASIGSNNFYNYDETDLLLPSWAKKFGHGSPQENNAHGREKSGYLGQGGKIAVFGNTGVVATHQPYDGSYGSYPYPMFTAGITHHKDISFRMPAAYFKAIAGDTNYAHLLTDLDGNDLGLSNIFDVPKVINYAFGDHNAAYLLANGLLYVSGYNGGGIGGKGTNNAPADLIAPQSVTFFDETGTDPLEGANYPKIKKFTSCAFQAYQGPAAGAHAALDTDGFLYTWGVNTSGVLGHNNTANDFFARRLPKSTFGGRDVKDVWIQGHANCSIYVICTDGSAWVCGNNADGQLGTLDTTNREIFTHLQSLGSHPFVGRKIVHVMTSGGSGAGNVHKCHWLLDNGHVYFSGFSELNGSYSGVFNNGTATVNWSTPQRLTGSDDTNNRLVSVGGTTRQKVVSMWTSGGRSSTQWYVTDHGILFSQGENTHGQQGTNSPIASGITTADQGEWMLEECQFSDMGDTWKGSAVATTSTEADKQTGVAGDFKDGNSKEHKLKIGRPMKVISSQITTDVTNGCMMLDDNGQVWITGEWASFNPNAWTEMDTELATEGTSDFYQVWVPAWSQPEKFVDIAMPDLNVYQSWWGLGESGVLYCGGYLVDGAAGSQYSNNVGWSAVPLTTK